jgi:restriction system protein
MDMTNTPGPNDPPGFIPPHGGYRDLRSFQMSELVYDATVRFCDRFISLRSRTHDQMVQAARSGNKNIAEGSQVSGTSKKMELKLVGVARASLEELLGDYQDFLRQRNLTVWGKDHPTAHLVRRLAYAPNRSCRTDSAYVEQAPPEVAANTMLCLIHQTNYLLDQQLRHLEQTFLKEGGFTERLYQARQNARQRHNPSNSTYRPNPSYQSYQSNSAPPKSGAATPKPPKQ